MAMVKYNIDMFTGKNDSNIALQSEDENKVLIGRRKLSWKRSCTMS